MPNGGGGHVPGRNAVFDNSSKMEPKRARQWFLDASELDLLPGKKPALEASNSKSDEEIMMPSSLSWETSCGFQSVPSQFVDRLFGSETNTPKSLTNRNTVSITGTDGSNVRTKVIQQFENDFYALEDPETGVSYGGLRKVKVNQVKDHEDELQSSTVHGIGICMDQTYHSGSQRTFMSIGQPYCKEGENVALMSHSFDIGEANIRSMGSSFGRGLENTFSMAHSYTKGVNNTLSFGGYQDEAVTEALARPVSSYSLLYQQSSAHTLETPNKKEVDGADANASVSTSHAPKSKFDSTSKNKSETKSTRKEAPNSFPSNVRSLIATGMLDGVPVRYVSVSRKELRGIIKGSGYLCGCQPCNFSKALNAYEFERHAGCKTKHPNNHIYFENGKTIYQIVQELRSTSESMLFDAILNVTGSSINQKAFRTWKNHSKQQRVSFSVFMGRKNSTYENTFQSGNLILNFVEDGIVTFKCSAKL
ncbi:hypothetical protein OROHE_013972 [Orobanche hederae]